MIVVVNSEESGSFLTNLDAACFQQAAIDLRLDNVWKIEGDFHIGEHTKIARNSTQLQPDSNNVYRLDKGVYEISFDHDISIAADEAALVITRSTLIRNGLFCASGLWDPKFTGRGGCALHVNGGTAFLEKGVRVAQFVVWKVLNPAGEYNGSYGLDANGVPKLSEQKYYDASRAQ